MRFPINKRFIKRYLLDQYNTQSYWGVFFFDGKQGFFGGGYKTYDEAKAELDAPNLGSAIELNADGFSWDDGRFWVK